MNIEKIKKSNTVYIGKNIIYMPEMTSTQDYAKKIIEIVENGTIVITDNQTNGKGTKGRSWYTSKNKNITTTIILKPDCSVNQIEDLTLKIANGIKDAIYELYSYKLDIKFPNDLLLNGKKICGILTQTTIQQNKVKSVLIGIGFNVNEDNFNNEVQDTATSLKNEFAQEFEREEIIGKIIEKLEKII